MWVISAEEREKTAKGNEPSQNRRWYDRQTAQQQEMLFFVFFFYLTALRCNDLMIYACLFSSIPKKKILFTYFTLLNPAHKT